MATSYGFFNSVGGDRKYNADDMSTYFEGLVSDGVYESVDEKLRVEALTGMQVGVRPGRALIDCKWIKNDAVFNIDINASHVTLNRYTAVVLRLDYSNREITITTKDGNNATNPTKPAIERSTAYKELCLAYVYVKAGATSITQANITDMRGSSDCPWVTGLVEQVDTSELFLQYQTAYEEYMTDMSTWKQEQQDAYSRWFAGLTGTLQLQLKEYRRTHVIKTGVDAITIGISEYNPDTDILYANINGVMFVKDEDYTISGTGSTATINFKNKVNADNTLEFRVLKPMIEAATSAVSNAPLILHEEEFSTYVTDSTVGDAVVKAFQASKNVLIAYDENSESLTRVHMPVTRFELPKWGYDHLILHYTKNGVDTTLTLPCEPYEYDFHYE